MEATAVETAAAGCAEAAVGVNARPIKAAAGIAMNGSHGTYSIGKVAPSPLVNDNTAAGRFIFTVPYRKSPHTWRACGIRHCLAGAVH